MIYYSKVLLFGEHTVVNGGQALATPLHNYQAKWAYDTTSEIALQSNQNLRAFGQYLAQEAKIYPPFCTIDLETLFQDLEKGLFLDSNIPLGYGLGSSGAVCAAVYHRYGPDRSTVDSSLLKPMFSKMESFFHGSSSGVDPLICYLNKAVLFHGKVRFEPVQSPSIPKNLSFFLLDTGIKRSTGPLVSYFQERRKETTFAQLVDNQLAVFNKAAIAALLNGNPSALETAFQKISQFQYQHLATMTPKAFWTIWKEGLNSNIYKLKICGAGGGGFILGLSTDFEKTKTILSNYSIQKIILD